MISSVSQYIFAVKHLNMMSRNLAAKMIYPIFDDVFPDRPKCHIGNSVIVFEVICDGKKMAMRVYMRQHPNLRAIYGDKYYPSELLINTGNDNITMADVVLCDWHEGITLQNKIEASCKSLITMANLSCMFEEFAVRLLNEKWAHGDIKPENIIFTNYGLCLIDFDATYRDGFTLGDCVEVGTRQFQHPQRDNRCFNKSIDDYPIALIVTALAALSLDKSISKSINNSDYLLIKPSLAVEGKDTMLAHIENLFAEHGDVRHYRIAKLLHSSQPALPQLKNLMEATTRPITTTAERLSLEYCNGYWGFAEDGRYVIPPLYNLAFEFSEGLALVQIGDVWHFIDVTGKIVITCGRGRGIKPFSGGTTRIVREDGEFTIYRDGRIEKINK